MNCVIKNAKVFHDGIFVLSDICLKNGIVTDIRPGISVSSGDNVFDFNNCFIFPGLIDVHVHLREPGFFYKETIKSGTMAAARGGFTTVCSMPNLNPVPDSAENLKVQLDIIKRDARVRVLPYGSITIGEKQQELSKMEELAPCVCGFSDDGVGVRTAEMMETAMRKAKSLSKLIVAHCEVIELVAGGCVHDGEYARLHGLPGNPSESEWREVERDIRLAEKTGCALHICHVSAKESVALVRAAKARGVDVTCETAPHYLAFTDMELCDEGGFRMNPPIRGAKDRAALIEGIKDGTVDMIATDHAPHSDEEKSGGLRKSLNGIVGLETAFSTMYTRLVKTGVIGLERLIELMSINPAKRFGLDVGLKIGSPADLAVFDCDKEFTIDPKEFLSMGRSTPFAGNRVYGSCVMTMVDGKVIWEAGR